MDALRASRRLRTSCAGCFRRKADEGQSDIGDRNVFDVLQAAHWTSPTQPCFALTSGNSGVLSKMASSAGDRGCPQTGKGRQPGRRRANRCLVHIGDDVHLLVSA